MRAARGVAAVLAVALLGVGAAARPTRAGFTASTANPGNTAGTGTLLFDQTYPGGTCTSRPSGAINDANRAVGCDGSLYPSTSTGTKQSSINAAGTVPASAVTQQVAVQSCGAVSLAEGRNGDHLVARGGMGFGYPGPLTGASAAHFDGTSALGTGIVQMNSLSLLGSAMTQAIWFKTDTAGYTGGGALMGFSTNPTAAAGSNSDHVVWMDSSGRLSFGVYVSLGKIKGTTTQSYNDGQWHLAVLNVSTLLGVTSATLYVDNVSRWGGTWVTLLTGFSGYWHLGWADLASDWDGATDPYFQGSLADAAVFGSSLSGTRMSNLYAAGTQSQWQTLVASYGAIRSWALDDTGTTTIAAGTSLPVIGTTNPCSFVDVSWGFTTPTSCAFAPASTSFACTLTTTTLAAAVGTYQTVSSPPSGSTQTSTITLAQDATYAAKSSYLTGIVIYAPVSIRMYVGSSFATSRWNCTFSWANAASPTTSTSGFLL